MPKFLARSKIFLVSLEPGVVTPKDDPFPKFGGSPIPLRTHTVTGVGHLRQKLPADLWPQLLPVCP